MNLTFTLISEVIQVFKEYPINGKPFPNKVYQEIVSADNLVMLEVLPFHDLYNLYKRKSIYYILSQFNVACKNIQLNLFGRYKFRNLETVKNAAKASISQLEDLLHQIREACQNGKPIIKLSRSYYSRYLKKVSEMIAWYRKSLLEEMDSFKACEFVEYKFADFLENMYYHGCSDDLDGIIVKSDDCKNLTKVIDDFFKIAYPKDPNFSIVLAANYLSSGINCFHRHNSFHPIILKNNINTIDIKNDMFVVLDIETTGLNESEDEIIEVSAIKIHRGEIIDSFDSLIKPIKIVPKNIEALTGITNDMLYEESSESTVLKSFEKFIYPARYLVGHNIINFDYPFLKYRYRKLLSRPKYMFFRGTNETLIDTRILAIETLAHGKVKNYKLGTLCEYFDINYQMKHRAKADSMATFELLKKLYNTSKENTYFCSKCFAPMQKKKSKDEIFFQCSNYPKCNNSKVLNS